MALQIVVAAEGLDALIALEWAFRLWLWLVMTIDHSVATIALANAHAGNHGHLAAGLMHVGHDGAAHSR